MAGTTEGALAGAHAGGLDRVLGSFDALGNTRFLRQEGTSNDETAVAVVWDPASQRVLVVGDRIVPGVPDEMCLTLLLADGSPFTERTFGAPGIDTVRSVAPSGSGGYLVAGTTFTNYAGSNQGITDMFSARFEAEVGQVGCTPAIANSTGMPLSLIHISEPTRPY